MSDAPPADTPESKRRRPIAARARTAMRFVREDIWDIEITSLSTMRAALVRALRILHLVIRGYRHDECPMYASALTFSTLMALVPVLALGLAMLRVFGGEALVRQRAHAALAEWTQQLERATPVLPAVPDATPLEAAAAVHALTHRLHTWTDQIFDRIGGISFTGLGGVGLILLVWMTIDVLGRIEAAFNKVWGVPVGRSLYRRFTDYLSVVVVLPLLVVAASSLPVTQWLARLPGGASAHRLLAACDQNLWRTCGGFLGGTLLFTFLLRFMPNTRVRLGAGLIGGLTATALLGGWLRLCAAMQAGAVSYGRLYGGFAVAPILLALVYVSWAIVLFAAEVSFAIQNVNTYGLEENARNAGMAERVRLALAVACAATRAQLGRGPVFMVSEFAATHRVPVRLLNGVVESLVTAGLLGPLAGGKDAYVLLRAPDHVPLGDVIGSQLHGPHLEPDFALPPFDPAIETLVGTMWGGLDQLVAGKNLSSFCGQAQGVHTPPGAT